MDIIIKIIQFFLCFTILVGIHELGHFLMARVFRIRVDKFYIFFDPWFSIFKFKRGDTEYGLGWLPLGGYCKIAGMIDEAMDKEFHGKYEIWGGDIDPDAVELSRHNAELAEVDDIVKFEVDDATRFHWGGLYGRIVTNPPYGERLLEREEAGELYKAFGKAMDKLPDTWRVYVLSSHPDFERCYGRFADKKRKLYNGMLKCDLFMYGKRL